MIFAEPRTQPLNGTTQAGPRLTGAVRNYVRAYASLHGRRKAAEVRVTFTDDMGNEESLTSAATGAVTQPLTATIHDAPDSHDGRKKFTFELRFSEAVPTSFKTLRDHAFTVTGGKVVRAKRLEKDENVRWEIHVRPSGDRTVTIVLPATTDCDAQGAVCTADGRKLSGRLVFTVSGP